MSMWEAKISFICDNEDEAHDLMSEAVGVLCGCYCDEEIKCKRYAVGLLTKMEEE